MEDAGPPTAAEIDISQEDLKGALLAAAEGDRAATASAAILINSGLIHRADTRHFINLTNTFPRASFDRTVMMADPDWARLRSAVACGELPASSGETAMVLIAASLAANTPVELGKELGRLGNVHRSLVLNILATLS